MGNSGSKKQKYQVAIEEQVGDGEKTKSLDEQQMLRRTSHGSGQKKVQAVFVDDGNAAAVPVAQTYPPVGAMAGAGAERGGAAPEAPSEK